MPYNEMDTIARGAFGIVYRVANEEGTCFAKKVFAPLPGLAVTPEELKSRFLREVRYQSALNHENVVRIFDSELAIDPPYFIMELAICSLKDQLSTGTLNPNEKLAIVLDVLAGLEHIHTAGYKHRDLKPQNILVFEKLDGSEGYRYALSDFGMIAPPDQQSTTLTATGAMGGTLQYASPEAMKNFKQVTDRSDIYSMGAVLHDLFVGGTRVPCAKQTGPGLIGKVIEKCTETNQSRRYENVAALREAAVAALTEGNNYASNVEDDAVIELLQLDKPSSEDWDKIDMRLQDNEANGHSNGPILSSIRSTHFQELGALDMGLFASIATFVLDEVFARIGGYDWDYCDVLASKISSIYNNTTDVEIRGIAALAMLVLGTHHNRWYVERLFQKMAGLEMQNEVAVRLVQEAASRSIDMNRELLMWENSIGESRGNLHATLAKI